MRKKWHASMIWALAALVASTLACNAPTPAPEASPYIATPETASTIPPQETPLPSTQATMEATLTAASPIGTEPATTEPSSPTQPPTPSAGRPTPASTGPLDFPEPTRLDGWHSLADGTNEATIVVHITGGAPPYTVCHDLEVFVTEETNPAIVFQAQGCSALVHTIIVESADGQSAKHDYWIPPPWCE